MSEVRNFMRKEDIVRRLQDDEEPTDKDGFEGLFDYEVYVYTEHRRFIEFAGSLEQAEDLAFRVMQSRVYVFVNCDGDVEYFPVNKVKIVQGAEAAL